LPTVSPEALVVRSVVSAATYYGDYRQTLRYDFYYTCGYCFIAEAEAHGISFEIDHYIPQKATPDLACDYNNLMYACKVCNAFKGDLYPPSAAQSDNYRFFKADVDFFGDHYVFGGLRLTGVTGANFRAEGESESEKCDSSYE